MKKLILTSTGLQNPNICKAFLDIIGKPPSKIKILFVPTASRTKEELKYAKKSKKELEKIGIKLIKTINLDCKLNYDEIKSYDVIYVCGGNTFYLLYKIKESGFDKIIKNFVSAGKLYFGVSAGTIICCPNIKIAAPFDNNDVGLKNFRGLNLINVILSPHYCEADKKFIKNYSRKSKIEVIPLRDNQAFVVSGKSGEIIQ
ncbi:Type 1 glutamine amidotransferase-like domain-containing protein [Candidatus Woesearchaeota archaeon]|nr:Type 1 glutamine amidotransferase-like domain-containing protein [Candidatus Woesearchaeota archaeon]